MSTVSSEAAEKQIVSSAKMGVWWFLASEIMVFGGLITSYLLIRLSGPGWSQELAHNNTILGTINTIVLLTSSFTMVEVHRAYKNKDAQKFRFHLIATILFGLAFMVIKAVEYTAHIQEGILPNKSMFWAYYYGMTGLHGLHVLGGIIANVALLVVASKEGGLERYGHRAEMNGLYWHFVDVVWIFLFPLLYLG